MNSLKFLSIKNSEISRKDLRIIFVCFLFLGFLFYGSSLGNDYNLDDHLAFTSNPNALKGLTDIQSIFTQNSFHQGDYSFGYRPIATLSFAIEYQFFGTNPFVSHLINLLLYTFSCFLVFLLVKNIFPTISLRTSLAIGVLFLAMPIHSEIVNNIKCRDELLMFNFGLISTILFLKSFGKNAWLIIPAFLSLTFSILSKKTGFVFFGIIPTSIFFHSQFSIQRILSRGLIAIATFPFIRLFRKATRGDVNIREYNLIESPLFDSAIEVDQISLTLHSFWFYFSKLIFPTELVSYYGYNTIQFNGYDLSSFLSIIVVIGLIIVGLSALKKKNAIAFGAILFLGGMLPIVNWLVPLVGIVAERFVTVASIGWVVFVVFGLGFVVEKLNLKKGRNILTPLLVVYLVGSFLMIQNRNQEWKNQFTLFTADVQKEPNSATLQALVGKEYLAKINVSKNNNEKIILGKKAIQYLENSTALVEDNYVLTDLAGLYFRANGDYDLAIETYLKVIETLPEYADPYYNLGWVYLEKKQEFKAIENFKKAIKLDPKFIDAYEPVVRYLAEKRKFKEAIEFNKYGLEEFPNEGIFLLNMANIYFLMLDTENAIFWYKKAIKYYPNKLDIQEKLVALQKNKY